MPFNANSYSFLLNSIILMSVLSVVSAEVCLYDNNGTLAQRNFSPEKEQCCSGSGVYPLRDHNDRHINCCGDSIVYEYELCCGSTKYPTQGQLACCGENVIDRNDDSIICCRGTVHKDIGQDLDCCGTELYNQTTDKCCEDPESGNYSLVSLTQQHIQCCGSSPYNVEEKYCNDDDIVVTKGYGLCDGKEHLLENSTCCDGDIIHGVAYYDRNVLCCAKSVYRKDEGRCCGSFFAPTGMDCCFDASDIYNTTSQRCCKDVIHNVPSPSDDILCCGKDLYDSSKQECCNGETYSPETHQCCGYTNVVPKNEECCGTTSFDSTTQLCCRTRDNNNVINKTISNHDDCCKEGTDGSMVSCTKEKKHMCGTEEYDPEKDLCCRNTVFKCARENDYQCCDTIPAPLVKREGEETCFFYNGTKECSAPVKDKNVFYDICKVCNGKWDATSALRALDKGYFDVCRRRTAMKLDILKIKRIRRLTIATFKTVSNIFDSGDVLGYNYRFRVYLPCRCKELVQRETLLLITNSNLYKNVNLGDTDVLLPYSHEIVEEVKRQKLHC